MAGIETRFITDPTINDSNIDDYLEKLSEKISNRDVNELTEQEKIDEEVFKNAYIPKRLDEVINVERDIIKAKTGTGNELVYTKIIGLNAELTVQKKPSLLNEDEEIEKISDSVSSASGSDEETGSDVEDMSNSKFKDSARPRDESPESKKNRKKAVKEAQAEKRKRKLKKHVKKRKEKIGTKKK